MITCKRTLPISWAKKSPVRATLPARTILMRRSGITGRLAISTITPMTKLPAKEAEQNTAMGTTTPMAMV